MRSYLTVVAGLIRREPIRTVGVLRTFIALLLAFWPGLVSPDQTTAILAVATALLGIDEIVRTQTTPVKPG